jgi:signal transduction histidine kinase
MNWLLKLLLVLGAALAARPVAAQGGAVPPLDSVVARLHRPGLPDTLRVAYLNRLGGSKGQLHPDSALRYFRRGWQLARRIQYYPGMARCLSNIGGAENTAGRFMAAQQHLTMAMEAVQKIPQRQLRLRILCSCNMNLGTLHTNLGNLAQGLEYFRLAAAQAKEVQAPYDAGNYIRAHYNMATIYRQQHDTLAALRTFRQLIRITTDPANALYQAYALGGLGLMQLELGRPDSALTAFTSSLQLSRRIEARQQESNALAGLSHQARLTGRPQVAVELARQALQLSQAGGFRAEEFHARHALAAALAALHDPTAYAELIRANLINTAMTNDELRQTIITAQARFKDGEQQAQIQALQQARRLAAAQQATLRLQAQQREGSYRDTLSRRAARQAQERLRQQLLGQQQAAQAAQAGQQVQALTQRTQAQAQQARLQQQELRLTHQQQELARLRQRQERLGAGALAALLLLLGGGLFWQYRRRQQAQRAHAATALRTRLAADLHDDVGNLLTQISLQSDLLRESTTATPAQTLARLERLRDTSRRAARQMADVVWGLSTSAATWPEMLTHMRDHAYEVLPPAGLAIDFGVSPEAAAAQPSQEASQQLYLIYKECLHNVVKHAQGASQVTVRLSVVAGQLCLAVQDDAPGPAPVGRVGGQGLASMRQRAEAAGGSLTVTPGAGGFGVEACLPVG